MNPAILTAETTLTDIAKLRAHIAGDAITPGDAEYDVARQAWNLAVEQEPVMVALPESAGDVARIVRYAAEKGLRVAPQGTGHNANPLGPLHDTVLLKTSRMIGVEVDAEQRTARVQAGAVWADVVGPAYEAGLTAMSGSSPDVGVVGYSLGGGLGSLGRKYGFAADHIVAVEMVTADGAQRRVTAESEPELFWAIRGGKGNFGIVTALEFELVPVSALYAGGLFFAGADAAAVLHAFREWAPTLPEDVATSVAIMRMPPMEELPPPLRGQTVVHLRYAYSGDDFDEAERLLAPMRGAGQLLLGYVGPIRPDEMDMIHMDPVDPLPAWEKGMLLAELTEETVDALLDAAGPQRDIPLIMVELRLLGGALARQPEVPNAVAGRNGAFSVLVLGPGVPELAAVVPVVGKGVLTALYPWAAPGVLVNFLGEVSGPTEVLNAWPADVQRRLVEVKRAVDPAGVFTFGHAF
jgi:UDP-N-acetylenolpyruvoylglucosamine reductase